MCDEKETEYVFEASYTDSREGDLRRTTVIAKDEDEAWWLVADDYYFGSMISLENTEIEVTDENRKFYE